MSLDTSDARISPRGWWNRLSRFIFDVAIILFVACIVRGVLIWPLGVSDHQAGKLIEYIFSGNAWGVAALVILIGCLIFRDAVMAILYDMPKMIRMFAEHDKKSRDFNDDMQQLQDNKTKECRKQKESNEPSLRSSDIQGYVKLALRKIGLEFGRDVQPEMRLIGTSYVFDGLMRAGERIYGIEVKFGTSNKTIDVLMHRIERLRVEMSTKDRDRFAFILCVVAFGQDDSWKDSLAYELGGKYPELILRVYNVAELK